MALTIQMLKCVQLPDVSMMRVSNGQFTQYFTHTQQLIGMALNKTVRGSANAAMHIFFKSDAGRLMKQGGDLVTAFCNGPLTAQIYTYNLGLGCTKPSYFSTIEGSRYILDFLPIPDKHAKQKLQSLLLDHSQYEVISETRIEREGAPNKKRPAVEIEEEGVYVLRFSDGQKPLFYVGKASNIEARIQQHADGQGAACVTGREFTRVPCLTDATRDTESWERGEVLERMYEFGIDAVRGWKYTLKKMPLAQKLSAFDDVCERFDLCRKCGRGSHFVRECEALTAAVWSNGLELRSAYPGHLIGAEDLEIEVETERAARQAAERRNAEAVRILLDRQ